MIAASLKIIVPPVGASASILTGFWNVKVPPLTVAELRTEKAVLLAVSSMKLAISDRNTS